MLTRKEVKRTTYINASANQVAARPRDRRADILLAARQVLIEHGYGLFTVRRIAQGAGLGLSHLQYHFPTKQALVRALFEDVGKEYEAKQAQLLASADQRPTARLSAWIEFLLEDAWRPDTRRFFIQLWGLLESEQGDGSLLSDFYALDIREISKLIEAANPLLDPTAVNQRAVIVAGAIEGTMLMVNARDFGESSFRRTLHATRDHLMRLALGD